MGKLFVGFVLGVAATFYFFRAGYGDRLSGWAEEAEAIGRSIIHLEQGTRSARNTAREVGWVVESAAREMFPAAPAATPEPGGERIP